MAKNKSLGGIIIDMILRDDKFVAGMKRAGKVLSLQVAKMRKDLNSLASSNLTKIGAALGGAGIAAGIYTATQNLGDLADQATRLGVSANSLVAFRHAAKLAGIETEEMDKSLMKMNAAVFEANTGNENLANTFDKLGLNVSELMQMSPEKRYALITERINGLQNATERASVSMDIFGKTGHKMQTLISGGAEEIAAARQEADLLGLTMDRIDLAKVQMAGDALDKLELAGKGFMEQIANQFAPLLLEMSDRVLKFIGDMGGMERVAEKTFSILVTGAGYVGDVLRGWEVILAGLKVAWHGFKVYATAVIGTVLTFMQNALNSGVVAINLFIKAFNSLPIDKKMAELEKFAFAGFGATIEATKDAVADLDKAKGEFWTTIDKGRPSEEWPKMIEEINKKWSEVAKPIAEAAEAANTFEEITVTAAEKADKSLKKTEKTIKDIKGELMSFADIADKGKGSANAALAKRANKLRERAEREEARGNFDAADRLRSRASDLESRVKRREVFTSEQLAEKAEKTAKIAEKTLPKKETEKPGEVPRGELGSIDNPYASYEEAKAAEKAAEDAKKKRERDEAYNKINERMMPGSTGTAETYDEINARMRRGFNAPGETEEKAKDKAVTEAAKAATEAKKEEGPSLIEQISELIKTLTELPNKLGIV